MNYWVARYAMKSRFIAGLEVIVLQILKPLRKLPTCQDIVVNIHTNQYTGRHVLLKVSNA